MVTMALCVNIHCNVQVGWVQMLCRQFIHNIESTECRVEERHGKDVHWILNQQKSYEIKKNQSKSNEKNHLADAYPYILYFCFQASLQSTTHYSDLSWAWWVFMCEEFRYVLVVTFAWQFTVVLLCLAGCDTHWSWRRTAFGIGQSKARTIFAMDLAKFGLLDIFLLRLVFSSSWDYRCILQQWLKVRLAVQLKCLVWNVWCGPRHASNGLVTGRRGHESS